MNFLIISFSDSSSIKSDVEGELQLVELWEFWKELVKNHNKLVLKDVSARHTIQLSKERFGEIVQVQTHDELLELKNGEIIRRHEI